MVALASYDLTPDRTTRCAGGPQPGAEALLQVLLRRHPRSRSLGIYVCRPIRGGRSLSRHAGGGTLDWDPGNDSDPEGWAVAKALVLRARQLGIQRIIWDGQIWEHATGWRPYRGTAGPHRDHLHIELTDEAAATLTMTYIVRVFGLARPPRRTMPFNPQDFVDFCEPPAGGLVKLRYDGSIVNEHGSAYHGSMHSEGMRQALRGSSGRFTSITTVPSKSRSAYAVMDDAGHTYIFDAAKARQLRKAGAL